MNLTLNIFDQDGSPLNIDAGGINIDTTSNGGVVDTLTAVVVDGFSSTITVSQSGYSDYVMIIDNVYSSDRTLSIYLVNQLNIGDADYNKPKPRFFTFLDPCSFQVDFYYATSSLGNVSWYVANELFLSERIKGSFSTTAPTIFQLKAREETFDGVDQIWDKQFATIETGNTVKGTVSDISTYLPLDLGTNTATLEYRPQLTVAASSPIQLELGDGTRYARGEEVVISPSVSITRAGSTEINYTLNYSVINPKGIEVLNETLPVLSLEDAAFTFNELGIYTVTVTVNDIVCGTSFSRVLELESTNFIDIQYVDCNTFELFNRSSDRTTTISVEDLENNTLLESTTVLAGESLALKLTDVSLYIVSVDYSNDDTPVSEQYLINNYCQLEDCLSAYIENVLCGETPFCDPCPDDVALNQIMLLMYTFFAKIHSVYALNNFYTGLADSDLAEFASINKIGEKLKEFCSRRGCITSTVSSFSTSSNGSFDWRQTNTDCNCSGIEGSKNNVTPLNNVCQSCG